MKFEKDVFISDGHLDNKPLVNGAICWSIYFRELFQTQVKLQTLRKFNPATEPAKSWLNTPEISFYKA